MKTILIIGIVLVVASYPSSFGCATPGINCGTYSKVGGQTFFLKCANPPGASENSDPQHGQKMSMSQCVDPQGLPCTYYTGENCAQ